MEYVWFLFLSLLFLGFSDLCVCVFVCGVLAFCFLPILLTVFAGDGCALFWMHFVELVVCVRVVGWVRMGYLGVRSEEDGMEWAAFLMFLVVLIV